MTIPTERRNSTVGRIARISLGQGDRIGSTIYGTVLVMAALTAAYAAERHDPRKLVGLVVSAVVVFWIAYVYAHALAESIEGGRRLSLPVVAHIASRELGMILAAVVPVSALMLGVLGLIDESASIWVAIAIGLVMLAVQGYRYARVARLDRVGTTLILIINLLLGASVVVMKVALIH